MADDPAQIEKLISAIASAREDLAHAERDTGSLVARLADLKASPPTRAEYPFKAIWRLARSEYLAGTRRLARDIADRRAAIKGLRALLDIADDPHTFAS